MYPVRPSSFIMCHLVELFYYLLSLVLFFSGS
jgi:hypothetical protein